MSFTPFTKCYNAGMSATDSVITPESQDADARAWLEELKAQRIALKRQLYAVDAQSASMSASGGAKSYTNRSVADIKEKIAAIESEIAAVCAELGEPLPFKPAGGVKRILARF